MIGTVSRLSVDFDRDCGRKSFHLSLSTGLWLPFSWESVKAKIFFFSDMERIQNQKFASSVSMGFEFPPFLVFLTSRSTPYAFLRFLLFGFLFRNTTSPWKELQSFVIMRLVL